MLRYATGQNMADFHTSVTQQPFFISPSTQIAAGKRAL